MQHLTQKYEEEKSKLNELGRKSLEQGIALSSNEALQAQSRRVDELINLMYQEKIIYSHEFQLTSVLEEMW